MLAVSVFVLGLPCSAAISQDAQGGDAGEKALAEAREELAAEKVRIKAERDEQTARMSTLVEERHGFTDKFVDLQLEIAEHEAAFAELRARRVELRGEVDALRLGEGELPRMLRDARLKVADLVDVLPPSENALSAESLPTDSM